MKEMKTLTIGDVQYVIVDGSVGPLEELRTTIKTSIVAAINELVSNQGSINEEDLSAAVNAALEEAKKNGEFDGPAGYTPVKGVDYWTAADQEAIVQQVIAALGTPVFGRVDGENNIILTGELADGTYAVKYEDGEGNVVEIGTLNHVVVPEPTYANVLATAIDRAGNVYDGIGYKPATYLSSRASVFPDDPLIKTYANCFTTGFIEYTYDDLANCVPIYVKGVDLSDSVVTENGDYIRFALFNELTVVEPRGGVLKIFTTTTTAQRFTCTKLAEKYYMLAPSAYSKNANGWNTNSATAPYARMSLPGTGEGVIITINEPIE